VSGAGALDLLGEATDLDHLVLLILGIEHQHGDLLVVA
jgi:hypothetical protein